MTAAYVDSGSWLPSLPQASGGELLLLCLPYAGGGASIFHGWAAMMPGVAVAPVRLPGRESRFAEAAHDSLDELVTALTAAVGPVVNRPYAIFGHSMGALIAFELALRLRGEGRQEPRALVVSACRAPQLRTPVPPAAGPAELLRRLRELGGTDRDVWANPELLRLTYPALRADFHLVDTYVYRPGPPLSCPIAALRGIADTDTTATQMSGWRAQTTAAFSWRTLPGGHFNITEERDAVVRAVADALAELGAGL